MQARSHRQPTPRQLAKLQKIKNPEQKHVLLAAIGRGEDIPEYAWTPIPSEQMSRALSSSEFIGLFADLKDAAHRENRPIEELIGDLHPGWKISQIAEEASSRPFLHSTSQLCAPLTGCVALREAADSSILCTWGFFNPYGPTCENLIRIDSSHGCLLYRQAMNPFSQLDVVYGSPLAKNNEQQDPMHAAVAELFASNGGPEVPLLNDLPSYIFDGEEEKLNGMLREHFFAALSLLDASDVAEECEAIRRNWCRPWDLASEHRDRALAEITKNRIADRAELCSAAPNRVAMTTELLGEWWHLVHESDHAIVSFEQMKDAWKGAIDFQTKGG